MLTTTTRGGQTTVRRKFSVKNGPVEAAVQCADGTDGAPHRRPVGAGRGRPAPRRAQPEHGGAPGRRVDGEPRRRRRHRRRGPRGAGRPRGHAAVRAGRPAPRGRRPARRAGRGPGPTADLRAGQADRHRGPGRDRGVGRDLPLGRRGGEAAGDAGPPRRRPQQEGLDLPPGQWGLRLHHAVELPDEHPGRAPRPRPRRRQRRHPQAVGVHAAHRRRPGGGVPGRRLSARGHLGAPRRRRRRRRAGQP